MHSILPILLFLVVWAPWQHRCGLHLSLICSFWSLIYHTVFDQLHYAQHDAATRHLPLQPCHNTQTEESYDVLFQLLRQYPSVTRLVLYNMPDAAMSGLAHHLCKVLAWPVEVAGIFPLLLPCSFAIQVDNKVASLELETPHISDKGLNELVQALQFCEARAGPITISKLDLSESAVITRYLPLHVHTASAAPTTPIPQTWASGNQHSPNRRDRFGQPTERGRSCCGRNSPELQPYKGIAVRCHCCWLTSLSVVIMVPLWQVLSVANCPVTSGICEVINRYPQLTDFDMCRWRLCHIVACL